MFYNKKQQWEAMFRLQADANTSLAGPDWRTNPGQYDYLAALSDEVTECRLAAGYAPFWSGGAASQFDADNLKLEIVDVLHFLMSAFMQSIRGDESMFSVIDFAARVAEYNTAPVFRLAPSTFAATYGTVDHSIFHNFLGKVLTRNFDGAFQAFATMCWTANMEFRELYAKYLAKNALNIFRKSIGYKQDKSVKYWETNPDGSKVEDNYFVMSMVEDLLTEGVDEGGLTFKSMLRRIAVRYSQVTGNDFDWEHICSFSESLNDPDDLADDLLNEASSAPRAPSVHGDLVTSKS